MKLTFILLTFIGLSTSTALAQQEVFIKKHKSGRHKTLKPTANFFFGVRTSATSKSAYGHVIQKTDSTLTIESYQTPNSGVPDTCVVNIQDIVLIRNYLIDNDEFLGTTGGMLIVAGILATVAFPIIWLADGKESGQGGAAFAATALVAGGLLILPLKIRKTWRMKRWEFVKADLSTQ